jgi:hypothetical protein
MQTSDVAKVARALRRLRACEYLNIRGVMHAVEASAADLEEALGFSIPAQRENEQ